MRFVKIITVAGLLGLAVTHADAFGRVLQAGVGTFRGAVKLGGGK